MRIRSKNIVVLICLILLLAGCSGESEKDEKSFSVDRLLVIGIDAADWGLIDPMIAEGRMPNLARLRSQSASGRMKSFVPLQKSPLLWASICTGVHPEVHGIGDFVKGEKKAPARSGSWKAPAIWDIINPVGGTTAVIGMWATYPARNISGVMVSDYLQYSSSRQRQPTGMVSPDSLTESLVSLLVTHEDISDEDLTRFIPADQIHVVAEQRPRLLHDLKTFWAADLTYLAVARELAKQDDHDLFFYYMRGPDMISHKFWHYMEPEKGNYFRRPELEAALGEVVPRYYDWVDEAVGEVLSWFPADRPVVTLSDHGFFGARVVDGRNVSGCKEHNVFGIFMIRSPLFEAGSTFDKIDLIEICPTMLALLGMPPATDMPGSVLLECLTADGRRRFEKLQNNRIETYQHLAPRDVGEGEATPEIDEQIREQLRSLGYI